MAETIPELTGLDNYISQLMDLWHVPSVTIAILKQGDLVYSSCFGYRDIERQLSVDSDTQFGIASLTKAFTAMSVGILVDNGELDWDTPIRYYLPAFDLQDRSAAEHTTLRDLLCHRSGLPRHDAVWYKSPASREQLIARLKYLEPSADFRTKWQYQNLMFTLAGYLVERVCKMSWEAFVEGHIFAPLGMTRSNFSIREMQENDNHALPYIERDGSLQRMPYCDVDNLGPAGSINSSLHDMTIWLSAIMNGGNIGDKRLVTEKTFHDMITPQMVVDDPERNALIQSDFVTYGLGWFIQSYKGHYLIHHGGSIDGYISRIAFIPSANIGVVVLSNLEGAPLAQAVALNVMDRLLEIEQENWKDRLTELSNLEKDKSREERAQSEANRIHNTQPSHRINEYAGIYEHRGYGVIKIEQLDETLQCIYNSRIWLMTHYHYDTFEAHISDASEENTYLRISFHTDVYGRISGLSAPFQEGVTDIVFCRIVDPK